MVLQPTNTKPIKLMTNQESKEYNSMKQIIHRIYDLWSNGDTAALDDAITDAADITDEIDYRSK